MTIKRMNNEMGDKAKLDSQHPQPSFEQRVEILLWGDDKLGIVGLKGRMEKLNRLVIWLLVLSVITSLSLLEYLTGLEKTSAGIFGKLLMIIVNTATGG